MSALDIYPGPPGNDGPSGPTGPTGPTGPAPNVHNVTLSGNTAGALAQVSTGTMTLAGGNNITLSQAGNAITISGANVGGAQTGISSIVASDTTYTSGSVQFTGSNMVTVKSSANQRVVIDATQSVQPGIQNLIASDATFSSGTVSISGFGDVTVNTAANIIRISAPAQTAESQSIGMSNLGNTSGTTGIASGAQVRMLFAGGNNITLSQSINGASGTITISAPNAVAQTDQTLGLYAVGNTTGQSSSTTRDARSLSVDGAGIVSVGYSGGTLRISATEVAQTNQSLGLYAVGNTTGQSSSTTRDARSISVDGAGAVSVGYSGGTLRISAPVQTAQTGISSIVASDTTYTSGSVQFTGSNMVTVKSSANQRVVIDATQSAQTQNLHNVTLSGNTAGAMAQISSGTMTLAGGANITLSQAGNAVTISGGAGGGFSAGVSNVGNTDGDTGVSGTRMVLVGTGPVSLSQATNANGNTVSINAPATSSLVAGDNITVSTDGSTISIIGGAGGAGYSAGVSNVGNTAGDTGITGSRLVLAGGNNVTLSQSTNASGGTVTISAFNQTNQSVGLYAVGNTTGQSSSTTRDARSISVDGAGIVSVGYSGGTLRISAVQSVQPETQTFIAGISASDTLYTSGNVRITGVGGGITVSSNTGQRIDLSVAAPVAQTDQTLGLYAVGNTTGQSSSTTRDARSISVDGAGIVSVGYSGGTLRISATEVAQTNQTIGLYAVGNTTGQSSSTTRDARSVSVDGAGAVSVGYSGGTLRISAPTQTVQPGVQHLVASDNTFSSGTVSISGFGDITVNTAGSLIRISGPVQTVESQSIGASNLGNTLGTSGVASGAQVRAVIIGTSNITVSQSVNGASATLSLIGQPGFSAGVSNLGNTGGATGVSGTRLVLVGSNNITLTQTTDANGATVSLFGQAPAGGAFSGGVSTGGNTAGATGITGSQMVLVGNSPISLSQTTGANGGTVSINAPAASVLSAVAPLSTSTNGSTISFLAPGTSSLVGVRPISISTNGSTISIDYYDSKADWQNFPRLQASLISHVSGFSKQPIYWQDHVDGDILAKSLAFAISMVTANAPLSVSVHLGVYTMANSTSANLLGSLSEAYVISSATSVSFSGARNVIMTGIGTHGTLSTITGGEYVIGMMFSATATNAMNFSLMGASGGPSPLGGLYPGTNNYSAGTSQGIQALRGRGSTTVNAMPANIQASEIVNQGSGASAALHPWIYIRS